MKTGQKNERDPEMMRKVVMKRKTKEGFQIKIIDR